ncbi:MAG: hypothetical protein ACOZFS_16095 [Thermodesulfobacteriota bacterium]
MVGRKRTVDPQPAIKNLGMEEEKLDRALVAGLMMEVILETFPQKIDPQIHRDLVRTRLKNILVTRLAGQVTLERFRHLIREMDYCFPRYYPLIASGFPQGSAPTTDGAATTISAAPAPPAHCVLREDALQAWLETEVRKLLPQRPHRKLGVKRLLAFLQRTRGGWFRLRDFERHFGVDRKTAWEYLKKFLAAGLLCHNHQRSAAVRYALASRFLVVLVDALRPRLREALSDLTQRQVDQVCDWLTATGGEPFGEAEWHVHLKPSRCRRLIASLQAAGLLEEVNPTGISQMFQLPRDLVQD